MITEINFNRGDFNDVYLPYLDNSSRFLVFYGGAGSGKSVFIAQRYLYRCLKEPYFRLLFSRKVARTIRNSQFQLFKDLIDRSGLSQFFTIKEVTMEIVCGNGNMMIAVGMNDTEKIKSIQEPTDVWCEEATEFTKEDIMQMNLRLRTKKATFNQLVMSFNPITSEHWIYDSLFVKSEFEATKVKSTYLNNRFIDDAYKAQLDGLKDVDENYYKVYALGEWGGQIAGAIYTHWQLCDHVPQFADYIYGLDFGFNNPTALVKIGFVDNNMYCQQLIYKSGLTNSDLINELKRLGIGREPIYGDAAEPQRIEEIYRAGFNIKPAQKEKDSVKKGIDKIKAMSLFILEDSTDMIKEIRNYKWAEDKNGKAMDEPVKFMDHLMDAMRMGIHTHKSAPNAVYRIGFA